MKFNMKNFTLEAKEKEEKKNSSSIDKCQKKKK